MDVKKIKEIKKIGYELVGVKKKLKKGNDIWIAPETVNISGRLRNGWELIAYEKDGKWINVKEEKKESAKKEVKSKKVK